MLITSQFNPQGLRLQLVLYLAAVLALCSPAFGSRTDTLITIAAAGVLLAIAAGSKLALNIPQNVYANYDTLGHAIGIEPTDTIQMSYFKKLRYHLGKPIELTY